MTTARTCGSAETCAAAQTTLGTLHFRIYTTDDVIGVLVGGALKNVIAIGAGISDGLGFGSNSRVALITRGLSEITRIGDDGSATLHTVVRRVECIAGSVEVCETIEQMRTSGTAIEGGTT